VDKAHDVINRHRHLFHDLASPSVLTGRLKDLAYTP